MSFPNRAGKHSSTDAALRSELIAAGIEVFEDEMFRGTEVDSCVLGTMFGWRFKRAWVYWICEGPALPMDVAEKLHSEFGSVVRVDGDCTCPSPRERNEGHGSNHYQLYHVDTTAGLKALADAITSVFMCKKS